MTRTVLRHATILLAFALLFAGARLLRAGDTPAPPDGMIGFRGDGSGACPADCKPPTEFDAIVGRNLVWKAPLPNHSNSSPIVVGKRAFVVCAAGWPEGQDCARLLCFDADSGKELWQKELDEFATRPEAQAKEAREVRKEYHRRIRLLNTIMFEYQSADEAQRAALLKQAAEIGIKEGGKGIPFEKYSWGVGSAEQTLHRTDFGRKLKEICGYAPITWSPTCLDINMPTPVSDGKRVLVYTGRRTVHAFDLDGHILWQVWQSDAPYNGHYPEDLANSPWVVEGKLLMYVFDHLWAYELDTGKLAWKALSKARFRHGMGSPVLLRLPRPDARDQTDAFLYLWTGDLVRVRDGKIMQQDLMYAFFGSMTTDGRDTLFISTMAENCVEHRNLIGAGLKPQLPPKGRSGARGLRFAYDGPDKVVWKELWFNAEAGLGTYPVHHQDRLYTAAGTVLNALDGKVLGKSQGRGAHLASNGFILAGGHLFGLPQSAVGWPRANKDNPETVSAVQVKPAAADTPAKGQRLEVLPGLITEPAQLKKVVAMTGFQFHKSDYGWYTAYSCPFASGNRLFVRTFDYLYCFGDKSAPFVPSTAFDHKP